MFNLLAYLVQHRDRIVPRQELLDSLWRGKVVSESALSSCVKAARHAIGDNGEDQRCIATIQGRGYRFIASVGKPTQTALYELVPPDENTGTRPRRASVAVMPFAQLTATSDSRGGTADALAHDIITRLAQLRSLFVIAQGTVFALSERNVDPRDAGRLLNVDYIVSGTVRHHGVHLIVTTELTETTTARIIWTEIFDSQLSNALFILDEIGSKIVAHIASEIETSERNRAILRPPNSLDAWEAHHRGLWHMYRFTQDDNELARRFFETAVKLDPTFSRAYAGLSFTHFQNAFQGWAVREREIDRAFAAAGQSLFVDERNPAAHWAMGRALWLRGHDAQSVVELEQAIDLSPSFALGHYTLAFVQAQAGDPLAAIAASDYSRLLSPYDPLLFGMLGARAIALVRLGHFDEAADWAVKAAARPNAHIHILAVAAFSLALAGSFEAARVHVDGIRKRAPDYSLRNFLEAFHLDAQAVALFRQGAHGVGMSVGAAA
ncbi:MAG: winged helix-turn-helix domain-containing protein [Burkholderiaceae bacterium]